MSGKKESDLRMVKLKPTAHGLTHHRRPILIDIYRLLIE